MRRLSEPPIEQTSQPSTKPGPLRHAAGKELLEWALEMMSAQVRAIARKRIGGETWPEIASALGGTAEARRKQYERGIEVVVQSLGIDLLDD